VPNRLRYSDMSALLLAFLVTNVDGFLCLGIAFAVDPPRHKALAVASAIGAFAVVLATALAAALLLHLVAPNATAWFGLVPAGIGVYRLARALTRSPRDPSANRLSNAASVFAIVMSTGADNVTVYAPLLAARPVLEVISTNVLYMTLFLIGCAVLVRWTPNVRKLRAAERFVEPLLALFFIGIGVALVASQWNFV
jgi:cadmium resistance protein CadD (predicted permease)